ncbi:unnamed protein product [Symbiodinium sp. CCMP2592]|nr:unnamed protein product [Symbiodinium sp. CCMP2592]
MSLPPGAADVSTSTMSSSHDFEIFQPVRVPWTLTLPACTYTSTFLSFQSACAECRHGFLSGTLNANRVIWPVLMEVVVCLFAMVAQVYVPDYLLRGIVHHEIEACHGICIKLQLFAVGFWIAEMLQEGWETWSMLVWMCVANKVEYNVNEKKSTIQLPAITRRVRWWESLVGALLILCKFLIAVWLTYMGSFVIVNSENNQDLIFNCVAMNFLLKLDDMMFVCMSSKMSKDMVKSLEPQHVEVESCQKVYAFDLAFGPLLTVIVWASLTSGFVFIGNECGYTREHAC